MYTYPRQIVQSSLHTLLSGVHELQLHRGVPIAVSEYHVAIPAPLRFMKTRSRFVC